MENKRKLIKITDIEKREVVEKIEEYTDVIHKFINIVNFNLNKASLKEPQIYIVKNSEDSFDVYWCFSYNNEYDNENILKTLYENKHIQLQSCLMVFEISIKLKDSLSSYFQLYITGDKPEYTNSVERVTTNSFYPATKILNYNIISQCIDKINETYKKVLICNQIDEMRYKIMPNLLSDYSVT